MEKQFVVLGLGIFGSTLVKTLSQYGREVIAIDKNPENVQRVADFATKAVIGDVTDFQFLSDLGLDDMDVGIVAIGDRLEDSILATMNLKELRVPYVIVKAKNKRFKKIKEKIKMFFTKNVILYDIIRKLLVKAFNIIKINIYR